MIEKNAINVRSFNNWIVDVAEEAGAWVEQTNAGFEFVVNEKVFVTASTLIDLIEKIDASGLLGRGLLEEISETFELSN
jgi:NAD/NADP transhydrogenase alpha subunit